MHALALLHVLLATSLMALSSQGDALQLPSTPEGHCLHTTGQWCGLYYKQRPLPPKPIPRGDKPCPSGCSGVGNCDYDTGTCYCPAGYGGVDCTTPRKRPCLHMGPDKRDEGWHLHHDWGHSRCAGLCDDDVGMCYCPPETKYGRMLAGPKAPLGAAPLKEGRPMFWCQPNTDEHNHSVKWGQVPYADLLGPNGWCNAELPSWHCPCRVDGFVGTRCHIVTEPYCHNMCSGHGVCKLGFCKCHAGWYGNDCSRKRKGQRMEPGDEVSARPWLQAAITPPPGALPEGAPAPPRKRPLIYVYDTWPTFNTDIMQYRVERARCVYYLWEHGNKTRWVDYNAYAIEPVLIELFSTTHHRTYDPEEADFFFVPTMAGCLFDVYGTNAIPRWPPSMHGVRPFGMAGMLRATHTWLSHTFPYFNRSKGQDHIWVLPHDEGACAAPKEIWPGILLSHWGRMDFPHISGTQYTPDNYTVEHWHDTFPGGWTQWSSRTHPCFDPDKDLVIPCFKDPAHYQTSLYLGAKAPDKRDIFLFFRGDVGRTRPDPDCKYSRCIRQTIDKLAKQHSWREKYNVWYGDRTDTPGDYSQLLLRSRYCLALPGDGWSARFEDAMLHGCIPVIIMDNTQVPYESILDHEAFSVRVLQKDIPQLIDILLSIPQEVEDSKRAAVHRVWHRFRWSGLKVIDTVIDAAVDQHRAAAGGALSAQEGSQYATSTEDGAFSTLLQWLLWRIPYTRGDPRPFEKLYEAEPVGYP